MIDADATRGSDAAAYDALWSSVAVLDDHGVIVATNLSWSTFATLNGGQPASTGVGVDYIEVCERSGAHSVAHGLRSILSGECAHFDISYSSPSPLEDRWFVVQAARLATGVLVTHTNITGQMLMNDIADVTVDDDPVTRLPTLARGLRLIDAALQESATTGVRLMVATIRLLDLADIALSHGRLARDEIVVQVVARARRLMRVDDFLVRSGPAALMLIVRQVGDRDEEQLLEELAQAFDTPFQVGPYVLTAGTSVDVVTSDPLSTIDALLQLRPVQVRARAELVLQHERTEIVGDDLGNVIVGSPLPMIVFSLPDQRVRAVNRAAADLVGMTAAQLTRRYAKDLFRPSEKGRTTIDLSALAAGAIDSYRARRTLVGADGPVQTSIWVRAIPRRSGAMALLLVLPADHDDQFQLTTRALMGPLAVDLASGTMNDAGSIVTLSRANPGVLHSQRDGLTEARELIAHVHADDQPRLQEALANFRHDRRNLVVAIRIRHAHRGWVASDCHLFATGDDNSGEPIGFVLAEAAAVMPITGRVAQLEHHLNRIAAEVSAAVVSSPADTNQSPLDVEIEQLTSRQREIVSRLVDGQRVPTIAAALYLSQSTVRNHLAAVYRTFDVHSQPDLIELLRPAV